MKTKNTKKQKGFIALFFILGISFTFITWISLSSDRVFEYIKIKDNFTKSRLFLHEKNLCADSFVNNMIKAKYNIDFNNNEYSFIRNLYYKDDYLCYIESINLLFENNKIKSIFFIIGDYSFEYIYENGFVKFIKSSSLI